MSHMYDLFSEFEDLFGGLGRIHAADKKLPQEGAEMSLCGHTWKRISDRPGRGSAAGGVL